MIESIGVWSSILGFIFTVFNLIILFGIKKKIRNNIAIKELIKDLNELKEILNKNADLIPPDYLKRLRNLLDIMKMYKNTKNIKRIRKRIELYESIDNTNKISLKNELKYLINELEDIL